MLCNSVNMFCITFLWVKTNLLNSMDMDLTFIFSVHLSVGYVLKKL